MVFTHYIIAKQSQECRSSLHLLDKKKSQSTFQKGDVISFRNDETGKIKPNSQMIPSKSMA